MPTLLILMSFAPETPLNSNSLQRFQCVWFEVTMSIANRNGKANRLKTQLKAQGFQGDFIHNNCPS